MILYQIVSVANFLYFVLLQNYLRIYLIKNVQAVIMIYCE